MKKSHLTLVSVCMSIMFYGSDIYAEQFYKWVDEDGVTHYGESLPSSDVEHVAFEFPEKYVTSNPEEEYYSIQNQLKRMLDRREQARQEKQERANSRTNAVPQPQPIQYEEPRYSYYRPVHHPIFFPHIKNKNKNKVECKGSRDCFLPRRFYSNPARRDLKNARSAPHTPRAGKSEKRGINIGIARKAR